MSNATQEALTQLRKTLELLAIQQAKTDQSSTKIQNVRKSGPEAQDYFQKLTEKYLDFTSDCPTTYHVIDHFSQELDKAGFTYLSEKNSWSGVKGGKYYTVRNGTNLVAFTIGEDWKYQNGVGAIGAHVDALTAKLKPASIKKDVEGYHLLGVAPYGGTLNWLWFDRDLGIAGRILVKDKSTGKIEARLISSKSHPIGRIPSLAPHFGSVADGPFDKEDQAVPVIGYGSSDDADEGDEDECRSPLYGKHSIKLLRYVASLADVKVSQLIQLDLELFDVQRGTVGGLKNEFIFAPRLDDRLCSFSAIQSLIDFTNEGPIPSDGFNIVGLFDNEEVGSLTRQGAKGGLLESVVQRVLSIYYTDGALLRSTFANSIFLSADVNHLANPNFDNVYLEHHKPKPNVGITLSLDPNAHMATDVVGIALVEELARMNGDKVQYFQIKNNSRSGGTIGPIVASQTGARTVDLGIAQLSMHSIRAATGSKDIGLAVKFFKGFFTNWRQVYDNFGDL
ncbi:LAMI_0G04236g1_1 [Lachancea mirantina]|uniref:LAMI_0G04236g1_1 n=1 Tax=Lachancea mirantina TaxID=1230905 RepID=A0A1G4K8E9_9SACH|nr:LAMI_0G04236g1_1 [Lachancea mirantina]